MQLWQLMAGLEQALVAIAGLVLAATLLRLPHLLVMARTPRRNQLLRTLGASPAFIVALVQLEALLTVSIALVLAILSLSATSALAGQYLLSQWGLHLSQFRIPPRQR